MPDDETDDTSGAGADEAQPGWASPGQAPREPAAPAPPAPGEQTQTQPPPPEQTASAAWQAVPTAPGPGRGAPPGVPRRGRNRWRVVLIALLSVTVLMVVVGSILFADRTLPPFNGAHDFVTDLYEGRGTAAAARLCSADRERSERAISVVKASFGSTTSKPFVNPLSVDRSGDGATVDYSVDLRGTDRTVTYELPVRKEGGRWLACPLSGQG